MGPTEIIHHLERNIQVFYHLLFDRENEEVIWKPDPQSWCLLEVVCHLLDEECEDFRARVKHVLEYPGLIPDAIEPEKWVAGRRYMTQDYGEVLKLFIEEREKSIHWLSDLDDPEWSNSFNHSVFGKMSANDLLANWLAHDYHHIRQINRINYDYLRGKSGGSLKYAGNW